MTSRPDTSRPDAAIFVATLELGGAERIAVQLADGLAGRGCSVDLVVGRGGGPLTSEVAARVRLVDLRAERMTSAIWPLARYLRREKPRTLLAFVTHTCVAALVAARLGREGTPVVALEVSMLRRITAESTRRRDRALPFLVRRLYPRAAAVAANGRGVAEELIAVCPRIAARVEVLFPPVVGPHVFDGAAAPLSAAEGEWFGEDGSPVVVCVARLVAEKDVPTLLDAFDRLRSEGTDARLLMVGDGPERAGLQGRVEALRLDNGRVRFAGADPNPYRFMARAAAVVLPSRVEGLPTVLIEALALGVPVVATDCPTGPSEILAGGRYGRLVPVGDHAALAGAITETLARPRTSAPPEAWEKYETGRAAHAYHELLRRVWRDAGGRTADPNW